MANKTKFLEIKNENKFEDVAYCIRKCIKNIERKPLPGHLTADDIIRGECQIPEELFRFMKDLMTGPDISSSTSYEMTLKITSVCSDIIYAVTNGRCKPA